MKKPRPKHPKKIRCRMSFEVEGFRNPKEAGEFIAQVVIPELKKLEQKINETPWPPKRGPRAA